MTPGGTTKAVKLILTATQSRLWEENEERERRGRRRARRTLGLAARADPRVRGRGAAGKAAYNFPGSLRGCFGSFSLHASDAAPTWPGVSEQYLVVKQAQGVSGQYLAAVKHVRKNASLPAWDVR